MADTRTDGEGEPDENGAPEAPAGWGRGQAGAQREGVGALGSTGPFQGPEGEGGLRFTLLLAKAPGRIL